MLSIYVGCFVFGAAYAVLSAIFGHGVGHSGFDHSGMGHSGLSHPGFDHTGAGHSFDHAGQDHTLSKEVTNNHAGEANQYPSPFNPLVIASAITVFGAIGIIGRLGFKLGEILTAFFAAGSSIITGTVIFYGVVRLMYSSQSNSSYSEEELIGLEAEVITPIPEKGMGEITYIINGERCKCPAKTFNHENVTKGKKVRIYQMEGRIPLVIKKYGVDNLEDIASEISVPEINEEYQLDSEKTKRKLKGD